MHLVFADDAAQGTPSRDGMRPLVATGGVLVAIDSAGWLENELDGVCEEFGFPAGEEFKWSPNRDDWMRDNLVEEGRTAFFIEVLQRAAAVDVIAIVMLSDSDCRPTIPESPTPEFDTTAVFLERVHNTMADAGSHAVVVADRPGGGSQQDTDFLRACQTLLAKGTGYVDLGRIPINLVTTRSELVRGLQLADLVTSCTTAYVSGEDTFAPPVFEHILPIVRREYECYGGRGIKIHPDFRYRNLYHWLLGDTHYVRYQVGDPLPDQRRPYAISPELY